MKHIACTIHYHNKGHPPGPPIPLSFSFPILLWCLRSRHRCCRPVAHGPWRCRCQVFFIWSSRTHTELPCDITLSLSLFYKRVANHRWLSRRDVTFSACIVSSW